MSSDMSRCCSAPASARHTNHKHHSATWDEKANAIAPNPGIGYSGQICRRRRSEKRGAVAHRRWRARLRRCETAGLYFCVHVLFFCIWSFSGNFSICLFNYSTVISWLLCNVD
jgi:hypothetical protein